ADPALEHFLLGVVSMPDFVERARERASLCIAALWLASSFGRPEGIDALRTILGDDPTTVLSRHRDALAGTELLGPWLSGVEQQGLNAPPRRATWQVAPPQTAKGKRAADITVVVPSYRHERFIERTLASVLSQTATDLRVLVVDDQSDDRTVELAAATGDPRVEVVQNTSNLGLGGSLAGALDRIDTPFVAVLNSDDLYHHERLERCRQALVDRDLDLVATALAPVDAADHYCRVEDSPAALDGRRMHDWLRWYEDHCRFGEVPAQLFDELLQRCFLITSSNLFGRTDYLRQTKDRWEKLEFCVDWQLFLDSARHGRLGVLSDSLLAYRLHGSNTVWFDEDRDWRYWLEVNQVMARVLGDMVAEAGDGDFSPVLAALAGPISCNDHVGGSGILLGNLLNHLGLRPRDLEGADVVSHMRELCRKRRGTSRAQAMFDDFGGDVTLLHRLRAEWPEHAARRSRSEALRDARGRIETLATGLVEERDNVERLWHSAEAERDQAEADKVEIHAEVAGEWERKKAELTDLYEKVGSLEGDVGRVEFEKSEVEREARETRERLEEGVRSADQRHSELTKRHGDLEHRHGDLEQRHGDLEHRHGDLEHRHGDLEQRHGDLKQTHADLGHRHGELAAELERLRRSAEYRFGRRMLNKMRLRPVFNVLERWRNKLRHWFAIRRLTFDRLLSRKKPFRAMASICWNFPIYSQTFVYQELTQLWHRGFEVRHVYSLLGPRSDLHGPFEHLWGQKHWFPLDPARHFADYERFNKRMPDKVARLIEMLSEASGLREADLVAHNNFLEAFTYTRMVEAWRPHYLHSYFFYDRSLYALVAAFLLDLPRGVSCYADHLLDDYDLKVVALHVRLCDIVIATSARIKEELLALAPEIDADKIIVKPNAIDSDNFPVVDRPEPVDGPHRLACVCRIEPKKGLIYLADAMRILRDERKLAVELHVVGEADPSTPGSEACKRELDAYLEEHSLWGVVHLEGRKSQEEVRRFLDMSQIFVASFIETDAGDKDGIPTALLEAMSTGITPVVTDAGSMVEVVDADVDGLIVAQRSGVALADAIEVLIRGPERRAAFGRAAAAKARAKFDVRVCEGRFHERVDQLLATRREGA
ncbi:MAG: glycosyltransferase, partial [Planctomycetota bacterium]|nr:glycosyltransferase [Planctomycetota bacterium]